MSRSALGAVVAAAAIACGGCRRDAARPSPPPSVTDTSPASPVEVALGSGCLSVPAGMRPIRLSAPHVGLGALQPHCPVLCCVHAAPARSIREIGWRNRSIARVSTSAGVREVIRVEGSHGIELYADVGSCVCEAQQVSSDDDAACGAMLVRIAAHYRDGPCPPSPSPAPSAR